MKKFIAFVLAMVLLLTLTACGGRGEDAAQGSTTTTTTTTTTANAGGADGTITTTTGGATSASVGGSITTTTTGGTTTGYVPGGVTVPIGTKPTTTVTKAPTTTTTVAQVPTGDASTITTTTTATAPTTTKPTEPEGPYIVLPAIGSDIDVVKQKNRIRVSAVSAWFNDDGTIGVSLTFKNYSSNWITEETDYVEYTCYDKNGSVVQKATKIMIGCIDTKNHPVKTFDFTVPATTAEVKITNSKLVYWTEWS